MIRTKSVHSPVEPKKDGLRILVARLRGHGLAKDRYHIWMANLGPTEELLRLVQAGKITWSDFGRRYRDELFEDAAIDQRNRTIKNHGQKFTLRLLQHLAQSEAITLLCHCAEDQPHCHRHVLKKILDGKL